MTSLERRRSARAALQAHATLSCDQIVLGDYDVINLAPAGILLAGAAPVAIGTRMEISLALDEGASATPPLRLTGRLLQTRTSREGPAFVIVLENLPLVEALRFGAWLERSLIESRNAQVLVVDEDRASRWRLRRQLAGMGHTSCAVATPLEAVHALGHGNRFEIAMVALRTLAPVARPGRPSYAEALDLMAHLADQHPYLRRIILVDGSDVQLGAALRQRPQASPHEVIARPCDEAALARVFGG